MKKTNEFDVLIIGSGATGTGIALDAATRGLKVACVDRDDFAAGTSSRSTKLIHGGIRYLENAFKNADYGQYELVKEALAERKHMLKAAPYMNQPLPIMIPMYVNHWWEYLLVPYFMAGAKVYDLVAGSDSGVPPSHFIDKKEAQFQFPQLDDTNLAGAIVYYDGQMNDTRMCLHLALTAVQAGATVASRIEVRDLNKDGEGKVIGAKVKDVSTGEEFDIRAKCVVNATGPFSDGIRKMDDPDAKPIIKGAAGVHVVLPDHYSPAKMGLIIPKTSDGRVLFFLPWEGATIAGTTDSATELTMEPTPTDNEVGFILEEANKYLKDEKSVTGREVLSAGSGIRPLVLDPTKKDTKSISRTHVIDVSPKSGLVTIAGGKWTTYRRMAEETVDKCLEHFPGLKSGKALRGCVTLNRGVIGADRAGVVANGKFDRVNVTLRDDYNLPKDVAKHLISNYGTRALQIAEMCNPESPMCEPSVVHPVYGCKRLVAKYPFLEAEVLFAVRQEYAMTAVDVLARRTRLAFIDASAAEDVVERVVELMAKDLGWGRWRRKDEIRETKRWLCSMRMKQE